MTHDLTSLLPRLEALSAYHGKSVSIDMEMWVGGTCRRPTIRWCVWDGQAHHDGDTPEMALRAAEIVITDADAPAELSVTTPENAQTRKEATT